MRTTRRPWVLIVGETEDPHVLSVKAALERAGAGCHVLDEDRTLVRWTYREAAVAVDADFGPGWVTLTSAHAVWWWRKETTMALAHRGDLAADFKMREYRALLESLEWLLSEASWPIRPSVARPAGLKARQLALAQALGFRIPTTMITNDAQSIVTYAGDRAATFADGLIYKPLTWYVEPPHGFLYTNEVTTDTLRASTASVSAAPCQFQAYIPKSHEIRVTVVGDRTFAVRVDSQARPDTTVDWRKNQLQVPYSVCDLPGGLTEQLQQFLAMIGLNYGTFDLVVSPDGTVTFLELNPLGQWLWLEEELGIDISGTVAAMLLAGHPSMAATTAAIGQSRTS